jgi:hypothetical protein
MTEKKGCGEYPHPLISKKLFFTRQLFPAAEHQHS